MGQGPVAGGIEASLRASVTTPYRTHERKLFMLRITHPPATAAVMAEHPLATAGRHLARYALVVVIAWIGALKYTSYEAAAIQPLIAHSPLFSWLYSAFSVRAFAAVLGSAEIIAALLIAARPLWPRISAVGSAMGVLLFASTLSFLLTTPGATAAGGFPVLSVLPGQFLLKDLVLIGRNWPGSTDST